MKKVILILSILTIISCTKEELSNQEFEFNILNDVLVFKSDSDFKKAVEMIIEFPEKFEEKVSALNFESFKDLYKKISLEEIEQLILTQNNFITKVIDDGEEYIEPIIDSPVLRKLLNEDGIIIVGNTAYKYTYDKVYIVSNDQLNKLYELDLSNLPSKKIIRESIKLFDSEQATSRIVASYCNDYFTDPDFRGVGKIHNNFYPTYSEVRVTTSNWEKKWYGWTRIKANFLSQSGSVAVSNFI